MLMLKAIKKFKYEMNYYRILGKTSRGSCGLNVNSNKLFPSVSSEFNLKPIISLVKFSTTSPAWNSDEFTEFQIERFPDLQECYEELKAESFKRRMLSFI